MSTAQWLGQARVVARDLSWDAEDGKMRHAPDDLAAAILELCRLGRPHPGSIHRFSDVAGRSRGVSGVER